MPSSEYLVNLLSVASFVTIIALAMVLAYKMETIKQLQAKTNKLKLSLDEMDDQAKLIVRTDMELNKTQEELDKKVSGLYALQNLSRKITTTLEENQIFKIMEAAYLRELGFEKVCGFLWNKAENKFLLQINIGYPQSELEAVQSCLGQDKDLFLGFMLEEKVFSSASPGADKALKDKISQSFSVKYFIIGPVLPKEGSQGFLFVGTENADNNIDESDEELITILTNQLGQAIENARLFEKTWRAQQDLEKKVEERTAELTRVLNEIKAISQRKTNFVSSVSHELRTPLTSIKGYASILLTGKLGNIPVEIQQRLEKINKHSDELVHIVNDLLDIARIESGKVIMKREPLDLQNIIEEVVDLLSVQLKEKRIQFVLKVQDNVKTISADRSQMQRVFINLINNALKFTPLDGKISIYASKTDKLVEVDITDTGCGIPEEAQGLLFEEFYRVDNPINQEVKGTGLGLALVKHIIEAHAGKIWVKSKIGSGSTFSLSIPESA